VEETCRLGQPLNWVVLSAGVGLRGALTDITSEAARSAFEVNALGPILLVRDLLRRASWAEEPRIVGVGSISARRALPGRSVYGATKAAFEAFLMALGTEVAARGIRVNVVSAGVTDTAFIRANKPDLERWALERVPVGRIGGSQEIASVVAYLLVQAPTYLTCSRIVVDGGAEAMP
jgi:NAD(P)-dependent dehydrogenase (short-subunit alcohol dehydrogenase family)